MPRPARLVAATSLLALVAAGLGAPATAGATEPTYSEQVTFERGTQDGADLPVTVLVPAPGEGRVVDKVTAQWDTEVPQTGEPRTTGVPLDTSACVADAECRVEGVLPTQTMLDEQPRVLFRVSSQGTTVGSFFRAPRILNPKPTVALTSPAADAPVWETFTITADATAATGEGAAPLAGVRFYLDTENRYTMDRPYLRDTTPPYAVTVDVDSLEAPVLGSPKIAVVAEDVHGRLSTYPDTGAYPLITRRVTVGPPPVLAWDTPPAPPAAGGSVSGGVYFELRAALDEVVPERQFSDPGLTRVERLIDGELVGSRTLDGLPRRYDSRLWFGEGAGLTGGEHTFTVRVHTSYKSVAELSRRVLVSDGVRLTGPVTSGGREVRDGFVVTAGDVVTFRAPMAAKEPGTYLDRTGMDVPGQALQYADFPCETPDAGCTADTVLRSGQWSLPDVPGSAVLQITGSVHGDARATTFTRTVRIQPAARLVAGVSTKRLRAGRAVRVVGRLTRADNDVPQAGRTVRVQWLKLGGSRWRTLATRATNVQGRVSFRHRPRSTGHFRLVSPEVRGKLGRGQSNEPRVVVRR